MTQKFFPMLIPEKYSNQLNIKMGTPIIMVEMRITNESLISTLDEVLKIQEDGRERRREAQQELGRIEEELRLAVSIVAILSIWAFFFKSSLVVSDTCLCALKRTSRGYPGSQRFGEFVQPF